MARYEIIPNGLRVSTITLSNKGSGSSEENWFRLGFNTFKIKNWAGHNQSIDVEQLNHIFRKGIEQQLQREVHEFGAVVSGFDIISEGSDRVNIKFKWRYTREAMGVWNYRGKVGSTANTTIMTGPMEFFALLQLFEEIKAVFDVQFMCQFVLQHVQLQTKHPEITQGVTPSDMVKAFVQVLMTEAEGNRGEVSTKALQLWNDYVNFRFNFDKGKLYTAYYDKLSATVMRQDSD